jgi:Family of unknown function (DUF6159)
MPGILSRFGRSWLLIKASWGVLRSDKELLVLPLLSGVATVLVLAAFLGAAALAGAFEAMQQGDPEALGVSFYAGLFVFYVVQYFVIVYFNTALVGAAIERLEGGNPTIGSALALAQSRIGVIFGYAVISATIGVVLRMIAERLGFIGRLLEAGLGLAWTVTTFLVVPVLAAEGVGPMEAIRKSAVLLKKTWGENLIGNAGISLVLSLVAFAVALVGIGGGMLLYDEGYAVIGIPLVAAAILAFLLVILIGAALSGIYAAAVYRYAVDGRAPGGFDQALIEGAFKRKTG